MDAATLRTTPEPLTSEQLQEFNEILQRQPGAKPMTLPEIDGYLHAMALGIAEFEPALGILVIMGRGGGGPVFTEESDLTTAVDGYMKWSMKVARSLEPFRNPNLLLHEVVAPLPTPMIANGPTRAQETREWIRGFWTWFDQDEDAVRVASMLWETLSPLYVLRHDFEIAIDAHGYDVPPRTDAPFLLTDAQRAHQLDRLPHALVTLLCACEQERYELEAAAPPPKPTQNQRNRAKRDRRKRR